VVISDDRAQPDLVRRPPHVAARTPAASRTPRAPPAPSPPARRTAAIPSSPQNTLSRALTRSTVVRPLYRRSNVFSGPRQRREPPRVGRPRHPHPDRRV